MKTTKKKKIKKKFLNCDYLKCDYACLRLGMCKYDEERNQKKEK